MSTKTIAVAFALLVSGMVPVAAQGLFGDLGPVGAWRTQIDIPGRPGGPIYGVLGVSIDGTIHYSDTTQVVPQRVGELIADFAFTTQSIGVWQKTETGYAMSSVEILASPDSSLFGVCTTDFAIQLTDKGASFTGTATFTCVDAKGQDAGPPATAPFSGKRVTIKADNTNTTH